MTRNEAVEIFHRSEIAGIVVPAAHVGTGGRHSGALPEWLQQSVLIEMKEQIVVLVELLPKPPVE